MQEKTPPEKEDHEVNSKFDLVRLALMGLAALISWLAIWRLFLPLDLIAIGATFAGGYPVFKETFLALRHGHVNMEVSMAVAIFASLLLEQFTVAVVITFFVLLSEFIENYAVDKGRATIALLEKAAPKKALVRRNGQEQEVDLQTVQAGDVVIVRDGERIPVDGTITIGAAFVNQAAITGEAARVEKSAGAEVFAGSVNEAGVIEVSTRKVGQDTLFGQIIKLVEAAENKRAPIQRISDRLATYLVEFAIAFSVLTFFLTRNLTATLSVVVVAGACGVAAGTPLAIVAIMGKAAKKGAIVKGGAYVEELKHVDTVVIDKTGTLTFGEPEVTKIVAFEGSNETQVLETAAMAEKYSQHPLARAIVRKAQEQGVSLASSMEPNDSQYLPGRGIVSRREGEETIVGNTLLMQEKRVNLPLDFQQQTSSAQASTTVLVARAGKLYGLIAVSDKIRQESSKAIADLNAMGIRTVMLTGDNQQVAAEVARKVGIDEVYAQLLPEDKVGIVEKLVAQGRYVAMVGDGINDAPALARAHVGIGMGAGTDVAIEEADIVLMTNDLRRIAEVAKLSRKAYRTIMTNFYGTVGVDGVGVTLAFLGFLNPLLAAGIHVVSELIFILNSARLIR